MIIYKFAVGDEVKPNWDFINAIENDNRDGSAQSSFSGDLRSMLEESDTWFIAETTSTFGDDLPGYIIRNTEHAIDRDTEYTIEEEVLMSVYIHPHDQVKKDLWKHLCQIT